MKSLWISLGSLALILGIWMFFMDVSKDTINEMVHMIESETYPLALDESWEKVKVSFDEVSDKWKNHKKIYILFTDSESVAEAEYSFHKVKAYIETQEKGNLCGELAYLKRQLLFLRELEILSIENII